MGMAVLLPRRRRRLVSQPSGEGVPGPTIKVPVGETVRVELTSNDVIHAFWVPDFLFKRDAIPGHVNVFDMTPHDGRHLPRRLLGVLRAEPRVHDVHRRGRVPRRRSIAGSVRSVPGATRMSRAPMHAKRPGGLAHDHRPQEDRHPLLRHGVRLLPDRRHARRRDADRAGRDRPAARDPAGLQRAVHDPRHRDDLPVRRAVRDRLGELPDPAADRRARHGVPTAERAVVLVLRGRRAAGAVVGVRLGRGRRADRLVHVRAVVGAALLPRRRDRIC